MSSRSPRRSFVAPFVVTLPLAACRSQPPPEPVHWNPGPPMRADARTPIEATLDATTPDAAAPLAPSTSSVERHWRLERQSNGTCIAIDSEPCPQRTGPVVSTCNPPEPGTIPCPRQLTTTLNITLYPGQTQCFIDRPPISCPAGAICNPPPPERIACPQ